MDAASHPPKATATSSLLNLGEDKRCSSGSNRPNALYSMFSSPRLQLFRQMTRWKCPNEIKKTAIYQNRKLACLHTLPHLLPLAVGLVLVILNIRTTSVEVFPPEYLVALQFAAKFLEVLMQASVVNMVLAFIRRQMLSATPLAFGNLIIPFRLTEVSSLWSMELWGSCSSTLTGPQHVLLGILLGSSIVFAALLGPSSAVLMLPRTIHIRTWNDLYFLDPRVTLFPQIVELVDGHLQTEREFNMTTYQTIARPATDSTYPIPVADQFGTRGITGSGDWRTDSDYWVLYSIPTALTTQFNMMQPAQSVSNHGQEPFVIAQCSRSQFTPANESENQSVDFGPFQQHLSGIFPLTMLLHNITEPFASDCEATWQPDSGLAPNGYVSRVWCRPRSSVANHSLILMGSAAQGDADQVTIEACTVDAYWALTTTNGSTKETLSNVIPSRDGGPQKVLTRLRESTLISLSPDWAKRIFLVGRETISGYAVDLVNYDYIMQTQVVLFALALSYVPDWDLRLPSVAMSYDLLSTGGNLHLDTTNLTERQYTSLLDYVQSHNLKVKFDDVSIRVSNMSEWTDPTTLAQHIARRYWDGYGYDLSSVTTKLSLAVVMIYLSATLAFIIYTLITGQTSLSWDSVAELVALALNSRRPETLQNTSVGINTLATFRQPVNVRVNDKQSLEIVFDAAKKSDGFEQVVPNAKY